MTHKNTSKSNKEENKNHISFHIAIKIFRSKRSGVKCCNKNFILTKVMYYKICFSIGDVEKLVEGPKN